MLNSDSFYREILASGPSQSTLFLVLSRIKEEGGLDEVIQSALKGLGMYPEDTRLRRLLAEAYFDKGLLGQAETELEKVVSDIRDLAAAYKLLAEIYIRENRKAEAARTLKSYLVHYPEDREGQKALEGLLGEKQRAGSAKPDEPESAVEDIPSSSSGAPGEAEAGATSGLEGDREPPDEDLDFLETPPAPSSGEQEESADLATPTLAEIYFNQGQIEEAVKTYERFLTKNPSQRESQNRLKELKKILAGRRLQEERGSAYKTDQRAKKEQLIASLEGWLSRLREQ